MTILKWIGIVGVPAIAILLLVLAYLVWTTDRRLEAQLTALREAGEPLTWNDLKPKAIPPEKNAAVFLARAVSDLDGICKELAPILDKPGPSGLPLTPQELDTKMSFEAYPKLIPLLKQAGACEDYDPQIDYATFSIDPVSQLLDRVQKHRAVARLLKYRVSYLVSKNEYDEALRHSILLLRLARHFEKEPMLVSYLVTLACKGMGLEAAHDVLQAGPVAKELRKELDAELARHDNIDGYRWAMQAERIYGMQQYAAIPTRNIWPIRARWNYDESKYLWAMDEYLRSVSLSYADVKAARQRMAAGLQSPFCGVANLIFPGLQASYDPTLRVRAQARCVRVINAIQARVPAGSDAMPKLSELGLPPEATTDPFTDKPLVVKKLPDGWLVYSVGDDLEDNGGDVVYRQPVKDRGFLKPKDEGFGPPSLKAKEPAK